MVAKKKVKKKTSKKPVKIEAKSFLEKKRDKALVNLVRSLIAFVIFLVLYFITSNYVLEVLFGLGALITGAISVTFILIFIGIFLYKRTHKNKR